MPGGGVWTPPPERPQAAEVLEEDEPEDDPDDVVDDEPEEDDELDEDELEESFAEPPEELEDPDGSDGVLRESVR